MVFVPPGGFLRGCDPAMESEYPCGHPSGPLTLNVPAGEVFLDAFWIDQYEVTVEQYDACHQAGVCGPVEALGDWRALGKARWPMTSASWEEAKAYCAWRGGRLPTEHEWEKAARGTDGRRYPWGNEAPTCGLVGALVEGCEPQVDRVRDVDDFPGDRSPYDAIGMQGNAQEWTSDWLDPHFYEHASAENPAVTEPVEGIDWVAVRGNYSNSHWGRLHLAGRSFGLPNARYIERIGFRCVAETPPDSEVEPL